MLSSETSRATRSTTQKHILEDLDLQKQRFENLKPRTYLFPYYIKVKQSDYRPVEALRVPKVSGPQISRIAAHEVGKVISPTRRPPLPPRKYSWYSFRSWYSDSLRAVRSGDRTPVEVRFSAPVQSGPGANPASSTMGTGSFPGVKRPGRGADHPPPI